MQSVTLGVRMACAFALLGFPVKKALPVRATSAIPVAVVASQPLKMARHNRRQTASGFAKDEIGEPMVPLKKSKIQLCQLTCSCPRRQPEKA